MEQLIKIVNHLQWQTVNIRSVHKKMARYEPDIYKFVRNFRRCYKI